MVEHAQSPGALPRVGDRAPGFLSSARRTGMDVSKDQNNLRRLTQKHRDCEDRLAALAARRFPTEQEQYEEATLKKLKLKIKDEIESIHRQRIEPAGRPG
jgi:uncharacterized protein YdcH (DUF465 family)